MRAPRPSRRLTARRLPARRLPARRHGAPPIGGPEERERSRTFWNVLEGAWIPEGGRGREGVPESGAGRHGRGGRR